MKPAAHPVKSSRTAVDTASLTQQQWQTLYANVSDVDTAQAILEMADAMPALIERHPSLLIQARKTLVFQHNEPERRKVRRSMLGWIGFAIGRFVGGVALGLRHRPARVSAARKVPFATLASAGSTGRSAFAVKSGARISSRG
ncbi:hypothetical protein [Burkholderia glumae]|uniref:hypothetical protein n=1 Tax=Burkholderia glumae TaxID=337 RepID=UPI0020CEC015|nr:hypothetical protein [Burkholderia glumae]MCQ0031448.1 hypothetical protein [Burkholderia glumae]MCQ0035100.1 hypothetical protein [Burkholderia glumae]UVT00042.1 hypothetical protein EFP19_30800 [Burkholderia glumae]